MPETARPVRAPRSAGAAALALLAGGATLTWGLARHRLLLYGDATAHLAIARRIVDSLTPGLSQWGTVWLPLPHLLMAPLVLHMAWWRSGLAGAIPSLLAFVLAAWFLHRIVIRAWGATAAAWATAAFCLNPSLLYLAAVPMTETIYIAAFLGLVDACVRFHLRPSSGLAWAAGAWGAAASLCRYDGWFALPFALLALASARTLSWAQRWAAAWRFCLAGGSGALFWLLYNWWYFNDPLEFLRGPYSARHIASATAYPGEHALGTAALYFGKDVALTCGTALVYVAAIGVWVAWRRRRRAPFAAAALLLLPVPWYLWAIWSGNVPIFVPQYWPHGFYNLRYGVQVLPAVAAFSGLAVAAGARAASRLELRGARAGLLTGLAVLCVAAYLSMLRAPGPAAYAEAVHNAPDRLAMEQQLAQALTHWRPGQRVLMYYGTYPGALADDGIAVHDVYQEANFIPWLNALFAPHRYVNWVVVEQHTPTDRMINRRDLNQYFHRTGVLLVHNQPEIEVYERNAP